MIYYYHKETVDPHQVVKEVPLFLTRESPNAVKVIEEVWRVAKQIGPASVEEILSGRFRNCFDYVVEVVEELHRLGIVSTEGAASVRQYYTDHAAEVRRLTGEYTWRQVAQYHAAPGPSPQIRQCLPVICPVLTPCRSILRLGITRSVFVWKPDLWSILTLYKLHLDLRHIHVSV